MASVKLTYVGMRRHPRRADNKARSVPKRGQDKIVFSVRPIRHMLQSVLQGGLGVEGHWEPAQFCGVRW